MPSIDLTDGGSARVSSSTSSAVLDAPTSSLDRRIVAATLRCVSRWGVTKTTLDDIAREAGCSRATVYRVFPGGKDVVLLATGTHELDALLHDLSFAITGATSLDELLAVTLATAIGSIQGHEALQYLVAHEPGVVLPWIAFDGLDPLLALATDFLAPHCERFLPDRAAREVAEALCRLVVSHAFEPSDGLGLALVDVAVAEQFVTTYLLPGLTAVPEAALTQP